VATRGGEQHIPRPSSARPGAPPPWSNRPESRRRFTLEEVRTACASLPPPPTIQPLPGARPAAVLVPIFEADGEAQIILTKRPDTMPSHRGEIVFPGGKLEAGQDASLRDAALREAHEEIGLDPARVEIVAELESMTTVAGRFMLTPFVGLLAARPALHPDPIEVVRVLEVPISELLEVYREERWDVPPEFGAGAGPDRPIQFFELADETVWGATARILARFLTHLTATHA
jgi:8-oxo-dGTP pyrophosphatase MutT (NUDIX family)